MIPSDGLTPEKAIQLFSIFGAHAKIISAIGTNLTNDIGFNPLSIVIKLVRSNGNPVVKLSDNIKKATGDPEEIERCKKMVGYSSLFSENTVY